MNPRLFFFIVFLTFSFGVHETVHAQNYVKEFWFTETEMNFKIEGKEGISFIEKDSSWSMRLYDPDFLGNMDVVLEFRCRKNVAGETVKKKFIFRGGPVQPGQTGITELHEALVEFMKEQCLDFRYEENKKRHIGVY